MRPLALLLLLSCLFWPLSGAAAEPRGEVILTHDLAADARLARERGVPLLLMVSRRECPYCEVMKREILRPMTLNRRYDAKVLVRELRIDEGERVGDFDGSQVAGAELAARYRAWLSPTLLFLDPAGRELVERMRGIYTVEMYGFYLDERIDEALGALGAQGRAE